MPSRMLRTPPTSLNRHGSLAKIEIPQRAKESPTEHEFIIYRIVGVSGQNLMLMAVAVRPVAAIRATESHRKHNFI